MNGDGLLDVAVAEFFNTVAVATLLGNGDGTFQRGADFFLTGTGQTALAIRDFNADGKQDVAAFTLTSAI